jgi:hypothetical protein
MTKTIKDYQLNNYQILNKLEIMKAPKSIRKNHSMGLIMAGKWAFVEHL